MADTPVSVTKGPNGQEIETYRQWNVQNWFDTKRWTLTGTQADSDFKAGLWWQDSKDLNSIVAPAMRTAADQWDAQYAKLDAAKDKLTTARATLAGYTGKDAQALSQQLDNLTQSLDQRAEATEPISKALRNSASIIETTHAGPMTTLWNKWEQDLANAPVCKADVEQMQKPISDMAQSVLDAANAVQKGYQTEIEPPEVQTPQADAIQTVSDKSSTADGSPDSSAAAQHPAAATPGVVTGAGSTPTTTHAASTTAVGTAPGTVVAPAASGHAAAVAGTPALAGTPGTAPHASTGPTLAGIGASTTAPAAPAFAPSPVATAGGGAATLPSALPAAGFASSGAAVVGAPGFVPFDGGTAPRSGPGSRSTRDAGRDEEGRKRQGVVSPVVGGTGRGQGARSAQIRPGTAARPGAGAGVAAGLLGRAAKDAESAEIAATTRRKASTTAARRGAESADDQRMFLDEDVWLTDDPGAGVVEAHQPHDPGAASATIGRAPA